MTRSVRFFESTATSRRTARSAGFTPRPHHATATAGSFTIMVASMSDQRDSEPSGSTYPRSSGGSIIVAVRLGVGTCVHDVLPGFDTRLPRRIEFGVPLLVQVARLTRPVCV